jgi:hypothetical protein
VGHLRLRVKVVQLEVTARQGASALQPLALSHWPQNVHVTTAQVVPHAVGKVAESPGQCYNETDNPCPFDDARRGKMKARCLIVALIVCMLLTACAASRATATAWWKPTNTPRHGEFIRQLCERELYATAWIDKNADGVRQADEAPLSGVEFHAEIPGGTVVSSPRTTISDAQGKVRFSVFWSQAGSLWR